MKRAFSFFFLIACGAIAACSSATSATNEGAPSAEPAAGGTIAVGGACADASECASGQCRSDWSGGYCTTSACDATSCGEGTACFAHPDGSTSCLASCTQKSDCRDGYTCSVAGACIPACGDCGEGATCDAESGRCKREDGGPTVQPTLVTELPARDCELSLAECGALEPFDPENGPGYENYPLNGETTTNQYRSYARHDLQMLVKYAAAYVDAKARGWPGNGGPIGLGDMSEKDGSIPGTSDGDPGHPAGTHVDGFDMDIGYFQVGTKDNRLRAICTHTTNGVDQYHCVSEPTKLDVWRTSLFLGALFTSPRVRVIGVDGKAGALVLATMPKLCTMGLLPASACTNAKKKLAFELTDGGRGWFAFHHHHLHISLTPPAGGSSSSLSLTGKDAYTPAASFETLILHRVPGHAFIDR